MTKKHIILWILILYLILILSACNKAEKTSAENEALIKEDQVIENTDEELKREENEEEVTQIPEAEEPQKIVIAFMGDVMMDSYIGDYIRDRGVDYPGEEVASITQAADLAVINLETSVSTRGSTKSRKAMVSVLILTVCRV